METPKNPHRHRLLLVPARRGLLRNEPEPVRAPDGNRLLDRQERVRHPLPQRTRQPDHRSRRLRAWILLHDLLHREARATLDPDPGLPGVCADVWHPRGRLWKPGDRAEVCLLRCCAGMYVF